MLTTTVSATRSREWLPARETLVQFLLITAQLALLFVALRLFEIEPSSGLPRLLPLVFAGFLIHAVLPMRGRLPFFLALSFAAIITVLGIRPGALVVTLGLVLFG